MEPDEPQVPYLSKGLSGTPSLGGCIMQMIDWIERGGWSDKPPSVHPVVRLVAIKVNDWVDSEDRQKLLDLIPRIRHTDTSDFSVGMELEKWIYTALVSGHRRPSVAVLEEMLDVYDHVTGRVVENTAPIDFADYPPPQTTGRYVLGDTFHIHAPKSAGWAMSALIERAKALVDA